MCYFNLICLFYDKKKKVQNHPKKEFKLSELEKAKCRVILITNKTYPRKNDLLKIKN